MGGVPMMILTLIMFLDDGDGDNRDYDDADSNDSEDGEDHADAEFDDNHDEAHLEPKQ